MLSKFFCQLIICLMAEFEIIYPPLASAPKFVVYTFFISLTSRLLFPPLMSLLVQSCVDAHFFLNYETFSHSLISSSSFVAIFLRLSFLIRLICGFAFFFTTALISSFSNLLEINQITLKKLCLRRGLICYINTKPIW